MSTELGYGVQDDQIKKNGYLEGGKIHFALKLHKAYYSSENFEKFVVELSKGEDIGKIEIMPVNEDNITKPFKGMSILETINSMKKTVNTKLRNIVDVFELDRSKIKGDSFKQVIGTIEDQINKKIENDKNLYNLKLSKNKEGWPATYDVPFLEIYKGNEETNLVFSVYESKNNKIQRQFKNSSAEDTSEPSQEDLDNVSEMNFEINENDNPFG